MKSWLRVCWTVAAAALLSGVWVSAQDETADETPRSTSVVERTGARLVQLDVTLRGPAKSLEALGSKPSLIPGVYNWLRGNAALRLLPRSVLALAARAVMSKRVPQARR